MARRNVVEGFSVEPGPSILEMMRSTLDTAMKRYLKLRGEGWGPQDVQMAGARQAVRGRAVCMAMFENPYDWQDSVGDVEKMSLQRVQTGRTRRHTCGGLILVNGMCARGHDPSGH